MKRKYYLVILLFVVAIYLSSCSSGTGGDFYVCENLLRNFFAALSEQNYPLALSYCKPGGITFKYVNDIWNLDQQYPGSYFTFQVYDVYNFSYMGSSMISCNFDYSYTEHSIYGGTYGTEYFHETLRVFEKVNGEWKLV